MLQIDYCTSCFLCVFFYLPNYQGYLKSFMSCCMWRSVYRFHDHSQAAREATTAELDGPFQTALTLINQGKAFCFVVSCLQLVVITQMSELVINQLITWMSTGYWKACRNAGREDYGHNASRINNFFLWYLYSCVKASNSFSGDVYRRFVN